MARQFARELKIFFASRDVLRDSEVVDFQTKPSRARRVDVRDPYQTGPPAIGQRRSLFGDALRIVPERFMKMGALSDAAVNEVRALRVMQGIDVRLSGHE